jgi:hypothetical protein
MTYLKSTLLLLIITLSINLFAQNKNFLISINLTDKLDFNKLENYKLPVYQLSDNSLITEATDNLLKDLSNNGIAYKIIDENPVVNRYFMLMQKKKEIINFIPNDFIYNDGQDIIYKNVNQEIRNNLAGQNFFVKLIKKPFYFENEKIFPAFQSSANQDSLINNIVSEVNADSIRFIIQSLQNFKTRFLLSNKRDSVANWIKHQFQKIGYTDVKIDSFYKVNVWNKNVIASLPATNGSEQYIVVGGHHDSFSSGDPMVFAPGADDNASGTAAVLEIARVLKKKGYVPEVNIKFVTFAAEEYGLYGGFDYADKAYANGMKIKLMINHDMISNNPGQAIGSNVNINYYSGSEDFREIAKQNTNNFSKLIARTGGRNISGSDSYAFWSYGYPAVYFEEYNFSPVYHSTQDIITNCNMDYCTEVIKGSCATLLFVNMAPSKVENFSIVDLGTGNSLKLSWHSSKEIDFAGYQLQIGRSYGVYDSSITITDTMLILNDLLRGSKYYFGICVFDKNGNKSVILEKSFTPQFIPLAPLGLNEYPQLHVVKLEWQPNQENDLLGYDIYRTEYGKDNWIKLNKDMVKDTFYIDTNPVNGMYYSYSVYAVDSSLHSSAGSTIKSRAVSLDQGILVVDETSDGDGTITKPTDTEVDEFYKAVLEDFNKKDFDILIDGIPKLADFGAYSTILWHRNDNVDLNVEPEIKAKVKSDIKKYLHFGGKFIYAGYTPSRLFEDNTESIKEFSAGSFIYDILKIKRTNKAFGSRFNKAVSTAGGYPYIFVDSIKIGSSTNYHLKDIESIEPNTEANVIYKFDSNYDSVSTAGRMNGKPVGVEYHGSDYKTITLSFPLYFMNKEQAKELLRNILINKFTEITSVESSNEKNLPAYYSLEQNYPNPFNPGTSIKYNISTECKVTLKVYDLLGKEVAVLVNQQQKPGNYIVLFEANNLTSGIYLYQLQAGNFIETKKMLLLK